MRIIIVLVFVSLAITGCSRLNQWLGLKDDHLAEEIIEEQVKEVIGLDLDFTPNSEEK